ncbi:MAG: hypothetical protein K6C36_00765, partial [Clostridia bacterium]|nr:hypothetical protein [Clostridia bacterium]
MKTILSVFLTAVLLVSVISCAAASFSAIDWTDVSTRTQLQTAINNGETHIRLTEDCSGVYIKVDEGRETVLDLNGHDFDRLKQSASDGATNGYCFYVAGKLTVMDSSGDNSGRITGGFTKGSGTGGAGVNIRPGGTFILESGTITDNVAKAQDACGGAVFVSSDSTFIMNGGVISDSAAGSDDSNSKGMGGGVYVAQGGTFEMNGGLITLCGTTSGAPHAAYHLNNSNRQVGSAYGGAVCVDSGAVFTMSGGSITDNTCCYAGGGVYIANIDNEPDGAVGGEFNMSGGQITDNRVTGYDSSDSGDGDGGGVWVGAQGSFNMSGGMIARNRTNWYVCFDSKDAQDNYVYPELYAAAEADEELWTQLSDDSSKDWHYGVGAGVFVSKEGGITLSGAPVITDNLIGASWMTDHVKRIESNLYISKDSSDNPQLAGITDGLSDGASIGVTPVLSSSDKTYAETMEFTDAQLLTDGYSDENNALKYFHCDVGGYSVSKTADGETILVGHEHEIVYTASGDTLTAECAICSAAGYVTRAQLMITAEGGESNGSPYGAGFEDFTEFTALTGVEPDPDDIVFSDADGQLDSAPVEAGTYTASYTLEANTESYTISAGFTITEHDHNWAFTQFTWSGDADSGYTAKADYTCAIPGCGRTSSVDAVVAPEMPDADCETEQVVVLTATVSADDSLDDAEHSDDLEVRVAASGHAWAFTGFTWTQTEAGFTCKANYACANCGDTDSVDAAVTSSPAEPGCEDDITFTATVGVSDSPDGTEHTEDKVVGAAGHAWAFTGFTWTETATGYTCKANYACANCGNT